MKGGVTVAMCACKGEGLLFVEFHPDSLAEYGTAELSNTRGCKDCSGGTEVVPICNLRCVSQDVSILPGWATWCYGLHGTRLF